jgi:uncharacterized protein (TIGR03083 family)
MAIPSARPRLGVPRHLEGLREAMVALVLYADRAGLRAPVPTTPDWTVRRLVAHQGMVHRWATATVQGLPADADALEQAGIDAADPLDWLADGAIDLVAALVRAPEDLAAPVFLHDAPAPREFWARRQCHETTIHAVDALAAHLGRLPRAADAGWIADEVALDGIDELLTGFVTRPRSRLRSPRPHRVVVVPEPGAPDWTVDVGPGPAVTTRVDAAEHPDGDTVLRGSAVGLYLTLWNRSDELTPVPDADWDATWRDGAGITWG